MLWCWEVGPYRDRTTSGVLQASNKEFDVFLGHTTRASSSLGISGSIVDLGVRHDEIVWMFVCVVDSIWMRVS